MPVQRKLAANYIFDFSSEQQIRSNNFNNAFRAELHNKYTT